MALPLLLFGASALAILASNEYARDQRNQNSLAILLTDQQKKIKPENGAIVSCGVFGVFDHTGIWLDGNIIELRGNGLIRGISPQRFLQGRSGSQIYIACNQHNEVLIESAAIERACVQLFQYSEYDLIKNNCHKFVWNCVTGERNQLTRFSELNRLMANYFGCEISWQKTDTQR
jgi:hypothetical protein